MLGRGVGIVRSCVDDIAWRQWVLGQCIGSDLDELLLAGSIVERRGCFATTVDDCGVVTIAKQVADGLERELSVLT